jgi:putative ATP-binding cassette transporter
MMWAAVAYELAGSWATYVIGRPLVRINFGLERYNADFRYRMVRIRENAESIALYHGEPVEERRLRGAFARIFATWWAYMKYNKRLTWLTSFYGQAAVIFPYIVAAPQYFAGRIGLGTLTQTADAFGQVQGSLSWFVDSYTQLAAWKAVVDRLTTFGEAMVAAKLADQQSRLDIRPQAEPELALEGVDLNLPDGTPLLRNVNLAVRRGEAVVLRGPSGSGKTTLFRALAGLWPFGRGRIAMPSEDSRLLFLPQKPYLPLGSLRNAVSYPDDAAKHSDDEIKGALEAVGLRPLAGDLERTENWAQVLSGGEQQRLAFARALLNQPDWLFLDEATSALPEADQDALYRMVKLRLPQTTLVSVGHRESLAAHHDRRLAWQGGRLALA